MPAAVDRKEAGVPTWVSSQAKKPGNFISRVYQGQSARTVEQLGQMHEQPQQQSPYLEVKRANKLLKQASKKLVLPKPRMPLALTGIEHFNPADKYLDHPSPIKTRKRSLHFGQKSTNCLQLERSES